MLAGDPEAPGRKNGKKGGTARMTSGQTEEIKNYVCEHFAEKNILTRFAKKFFYTKEMISIEFKRKTGITFTEFIQRKRLEKFKEYLESGEGIKQSFLKIGYSYPGCYSWLSPKYENYFGEKPIETLRRAKGENK